MEEWRGVHYNGIDFTDYYEVSNLGNVRSLDRTNKRGFHFKGKILKQFKNKYGYFTVNFSKDDKVWSPTVHLLVAKEFPEICGEYFKGCQIDHINTVRTDNRAENLKVCTQAENINNPLTREHLKESWDKNNMRERKSLAIKKSWQDPESRKRQLNGIEQKKRAVIQLSMNDTFIKEWNCATDASNGTGVNRSHITSCCINRYGFKSAGGYKWVYKDNYKEAI